MLTGMLDAMAKMDRARTFPQRPMAIETDEKIQKYSPFMFPYPSSFINNDEENIDRAENFLHETKY